jgi:hypothetical protein
MLQIWQDPNRDVREGMRREISFKVHSTSRCIRPIRSIRPVQFFLGASAATDQPSHGVTSTNAKVVQGGYSRCDRPGGT